MNASTVRQAPWAHARAALRRVVVVLVPLVSLVAGLVVLSSMYAPDNVFRALRHANVVLVVLAFLLGSGIEALKAERATLMLSQCRAIRFEETFGIQVVSHGFGHLVPLAPTTMGLRCLLTYGLKRIPMLFSAGVFLTASVLDSSALLPLLMYLLVAVSLPVWQRILLSGVLVQTGIFLLVPLLGGWLQSLLARVACSDRVTGFVRRTATIIECAVNGMAAMLSGGWKKTVLLVCLTIFMAALGVLRPELLLQAFGLQVSWNQLCLLMIFSSLVGNLSIPIPGAGTWATAKALAVAGVAGSGIGGYILVIRAISSIETPLLALFVLVWWSIPRSPSSIHLKDIRELRKLPLFSSTQSPQVSQPHDSLPTSRPHDGG